MSKLVNNIYDIDGNIIRKAGEGRFTIEETEELVDKLTQKVQENPDNEIYKVYLNNAQKWLMHLYDGMSRQDLMKRMSILKDSVQEAKDNATEAEKEVLAKVTEAMEELKKEYENENTEPKTPEVLESGHASVGQDDLLVEREGETVMEEVIDA